MHIALCDDDKTELSRLCSLLEECSRVKKCSITYEAFQNANELLEAIKDRCFDLLFLDILMPGVTGMDAAIEIRQSDSDVPIIFLTSSREFAVESYRVRAEDYIMKPAGKDEIFPAIDRQMRKMAQGQTYLTLKTEGSFTRLPLEKIVYVEVKNRRLYFTLADSVVREVYGYLADYEKELLSSPSFCKPHRSYIVNLCYVTGLQKNALDTTLGNTVPIARDAFAKVKASYLKHLLKPVDRKSGQL
jgi:DNA-binding LytR/AlgR family response regulator